MTPALAVMLALVAFVTFGINLGALAVLVSQRTDMLAHSDRDIHNLAVLLAKQTESSLQTVEAINGTIADHLTGFGLDDRNLLARQGSRRFVHDMLLRDLAPLDSVTSMSIVDANGHRLSTSDIFPAPPVDVSERDYFRPLANDPHRRIFIGRPVADGSADERSIPVARRLNDSAGGFAGLLVSDLSVDTFETLYRGINLDGTRNIVLVRDDGVVISGRKDEASATALSPPSILQYRATLLARSASSGVVATAGGATAYRTAAAEVGAYPLLVVAQYDVGHVLGDWYNRSMLVGGMVLLVDLSVVVACILCFRHLRQSRQIGAAERHSARHDMMTGLPNRAYFQETLDEALADVDRVPFGLILVDLDNFKEVNDSQGHQAGDLLLKLVAARLGACLGPSDMLARLGGDEFAIIQRCISGRHDVERLAAAALETFSTPFPIRERQLNVGASFGIALGGGGQNADLLFDQADMALYQSKALGRGTIRLFSPELQTEKVERKKLANDLKEAVAQKAFQVYFQPIIDLRTCRLAGFEALLRWHDPDRGAVPPSTFIPLAEEIGAIGPLGSWVLRESCMRAASWPGDIRVAVNLSAVQMQLSDVAADVEAALAESGLPASRLEIEITESVLLDHPSAEKTLHRLVALGISISLDDFGTGYSSLSYLCSFPFGRIKIDRSFVSRMLENKEAAAIVETVRDLAFRLGTGVTAEGIESHAQLRRLQEIGCDAGQGYLISKPMPHREVTRFIETFSNTTPVADLDLDLAEPALPETRVA